MPPRCARWCKPLTRPRKTRPTMISPFSKPISPGKFAVAEVPGADGKPEAVLSYEGAALNGDFNVVDQFLKTSGVPRPPSLRARGTTSSA